MGKKKYFDLDDPYWNREWVLFNHRPWLFEFKHEHPVRYKISRLRKRFCAWLIKLRHSSPIAGYALRLMYNNKSSRSSQAIKRQSIARSNSALGLRLLKYT